jgi:hypothetical protein
MVKGSMSVRLSSVPLVSDCLCPAVCDVVFRRHQDSLYTLRDGKSPRVCPFPQSLTLAKDNDVR